MNQNASPSHSITDPGHSHTVDTSDTFSGSTVGLAEPGAFVITTDEPNVVNTATTGISIAPHDIAHTHTVSGTTGTGSGSGTDYYQPHLVVNYIIKHD
jgi:microcystin-dependent protein